MPKAFPITPECKVAAVLEHYPELEDLLIGMAPPFKKLRNPLLRRSVAKVASLRQAAAVGRISVDEMVNELRKAVGQEPIILDTTVDVASYYSAQPEWFDRSRVVGSIDEKNVDPNEMPLKSLIQRTREIADGEIIELVTSYLPAPGIDIMRRKGFRTWSTDQGGITKTYFSKPV